MIKYDTNTLDRQKTNKQILTAINGKKSMKTLARRKVKFTDVLGHNCCITDIFEDKF